MQFFIYFTFANLFNFIYFLIFIFIYFFFFNLLFYLLLYFIIFIQLKYNTIQIVTYILFRHLERQGEFFFCFCFFFILKCFCFCFSLSIYNIACMIGILQVYRAFINYIFCFTLVYSFMFVCMYVCNKYKQVFFI